jgi:hypothetical protein
VFDPGRVLSRSCRRAAKYGEFCAQHKPDDEAKPTPEPGTSVNLVLVGVFEDGVKVQRRIYERRGGTYFDAPAQNPPDKYGDPSEAPIGLRRKRVVDLPAVGGLTGSWVLAETEDEARKVLVEMYERLVKRRRLDLTEAEDGLRALVEVPRDADAVASAPV